MGDYNLSGLSTRSFEKLIQALAVKNLGAGTVVFGDGPDGGREATFEGCMDYPSKAEPWDGYCVIQAKFRQRPEGTGKDGKWALEQLEQELKDYADRKKSRRSPEYYIFAVNAVLSPARDKGAKDKAAALFRKYKKTVPIRDWRIWDRDQIGTFLDDAADIRRAYAAWTTPGDVLAAVIDGLQPERPDFQEVMASFLARDLLRDRYANLASPKVAASRNFLRLFQRIGSADIGQLGPIARWAQDDENWLVVLDAIGRTLPLFYNRIAGESLLLELVSSLSLKHPDKPGLLPILIGTLLAQQNRRTVPLPAARFEDFVAPPVQRAALLLELANGNMTLARATELAAATLQESDLDSSLMANAIQILEGFEHFDKASEHYLLELAELLKERQDWTGMRAILNTLENYFGRRTSGLNDNDTWQRLALPKGLLATTP